MEKFINRLSVANIIFGENMVQNVENIGFT